MARKPVILRFDVKSGELSIIIDKEELVIEHFILDSTKRYHITSLLPFYQEKLIKKLVSNMVLEK
jgi:hypothetical protein